MDLWDDELYGDPNDPGTYAPPGVLPDPGYPQMPPGWNWNQAAIDEVPSQWRPGNNPASTGGGGMSEADGRAYDAANGLIGGYMGANGWVNGSPSGGGGGFSSGGGSGFGSGFGGGGFGEAPRYNAPAWMDPGAFDAGPEFSYQGFTAPDPSKVGDDPAFQFRFNQGIKALSNSRAGQGTFRSGATGQALQDYGQNAASQEYGNIWNRSLSEYDTNRNNAFGNWAAQYGQRKDAYGFKSENTGRQNTFNLSNAQNDWNALFQDWSKRGDWETSWLSSLANAGDE